MTSKYTVSKGAILQYICKGELPPPTKCVFQVMATRKIQTPSPDSSKYRISISDGVHRYSQAVLMLENETQVPEDLSLISIDVRNAKNSMKNVSDKLILVIGAFKVLEQTNSRIGNPVPVPNKATPGPSTPSTSTDRKEPPPLAYKRPKSPNDPSSNSEDETAKKARRNLFPCKTTHTIKDLNPYQNKYTVQARITKKSPLKHWNNSRGEGCVFDFVIKDASGEIKVSAFNEEAKKHFDMLQEGKVFYLSNAKIQPIRKPEYNTVSCC